ncbi:hypothetical protein W04_2341 [Pseudoalteromonas sp. SW0106-04]|nr:hypothetical protein W04_2341 [Pseudoalteromonas sp. SW0106-04]
MGAASTLLLNYAVTLSKPLRHSVFFNDHLSSDCSLASDPEVNHRLF